MAIPLLQVLYMILKCSFTLNSIENMIDDSCTYDDLEVSDGMQAVKCIVKCLVQK